MSREELLDALQLRLGYRFRDSALLEMALTHRSWANEKGRRVHYERVEFLGDTVLDLLVAHWLYERYPDLAEGDLSRLKSSIVSEPALARWAAELDLGAALRLGIGEDRSGGRHKPSLLADAVEAVLGAIFLDGGMQAVRETSASWLESGLAAEIGEWSVSDAKTMLQEAAQSRGLELPVYHHVSEDGPDHQKRFHVECWLGGERLGSGSGASKKQAQQEAARAALEVLHRD